MQPHTDKMQGAKVARGPSWPGCMHARIHVTESRKPLRRRENDAAITSEMRLAAQSESRVCRVSGR